MNEPKTTTCSDVLVAEPVAAFVKAVASGASVT